MSRDSHDLNANIIDANVYVSHWPTRQLPYAETRRIVAELKRRGVTSAWTGSFDGLLHHDLSAVNARLTEECRTHGEDFLIPFGTINPQLSGWQKDLQDCIEQHGMRGIRLHPNYHDYDLHSPSVAELMDTCAERQLVMQVVVMMEDERTQHNLMRVKRVDLAPLVSLVKNRPRLKVVVLNGLNTSTSDVASTLAGMGNVWFETAMLEGVGGIERLLKLLPIDRLLFGSYFPFFYFDAAILKLRESELGHALVDAITRTNALRILEH